jgi:hypothetical protein
MDYQERIEAKVGIIFQIADQYLSGQIPFEEAKDLLSSEMVNIRSAQFGAMKMRLGERLQETGNQGKSEKLFQLFQNYLSPPYHKLQAGHPLKNYYEENSRVRSALIKIDEMESGEAAAEDWNALYEFLIGFTAHIKRLQKNFYPLLITMGMKLQAEKAKEMGNAIFSEVSVNLDRLNNGDLVDFLYHQRGFSQLFINYLDLEERVLFAKALKSFTDQDFTKLRSADDEEGYFLIEKPAAYVPAMSNAAADYALPVRNVAANFASPTNNTAPDCGLILSSLLESKDLGIIFYTLSGELVSVMGSHVTESDFQLSSDTRNDLLNRDGKPVSYRFSQGNQLFKITSRLVMDKMGARRGILKIKERISGEDEADAGSLETFESIDATQNIAELFRMYPKFKEDFFHMDEELRGLKGPLGMDLLKDSNVDMLARSLRIDAADLAERINELLKSY